MSVNVQKKPKAAYQYVEGMRNIVYLTGFVRDVQGNTFKIQQIGGYEQAVQVEVRPGTRLPRENTPITATCHIRGFTREDGQRTCKITAFDLAQPSTRTMPTLAAWNVPVKGKADSFSPFTDSGELKGSLAEQVLPADSPVDEFEAIVRDMLVATKGKLDSKLGENSNTVIFAGFVESAAIVKATEFQKPYLGVLIRQTEDPSESIPVRIKSDNLMSHLKSISVGRPVQCIGQARIKLVMSPDGKEIVDRFAYIETAELRVAGFGPNDSITAIPPWLRAFRDRLVSDRENRRATALAAQQTAAERKTSAAIDKADQDQADIARAKQSGAVIL